MPKLHLIFSHTLTPTQKKEAYERFGITEIVSLPEDLQRLWSNIPPELSSLATYLAPLIAYLEENVRCEDVALVQGDFGATCKTVSYVQALGATAVYATSEREVKEIREGYEVIKRSVFRHVRFRIYERCTYRPEEEFEAFTAEKRMLKSARNIKGTSLAEYKAIEGSLNDEG